MEDIFKTNKKKRKFSWAYVLTNHPITRWSIFFDYFFFCITISVNSGYKKTCVSKKFNTKNMYDSNLFNFLSKMIDIFLTPTYFICDVFIG